MDQNKDFFTIIGEFITDLVTALGTTLKVAVLRAYKALQGVSLPKARVRQPPHLENPLQPQKSIRQPGLIENSTALAKRAMEERERRERHQALYPDMLVDFKNWHITDPRLLVEKPKMVTVLKDITAGVVDVNEPPKVVESETMTFEEFLAHWENRSKKEKK